MMPFMPSGRSRGSSESILTSVIARLLDDGRRRSKFVVRWWGGLKCVARFRIALCALNPRGSSTVPLSAIATRLFIYSVNAFLVGMSIAQVHWQPALE